MGIPQSSRILITGGAGFVGCHLARALVERGHGVRVLDALVEQVHPTGMRPAALPAEVELIRGDVCDPAVVREALRDVDAVYHLASEVGVGQSMYAIGRFVRANALGTAVLLEEIVRNHRGLRKLVVASSMTLYGEGCGYCERHGRVEPGLRSPEALIRRQWEPTCPQCEAPLQPAPTPETKLPVPTSVYAVSKRDQEELCLAVGRAYEIPTVALRYFNIYGPGQALTNPYTGVISIFCRRLMEGQPITIYEDGAQSRDFVHVNDIVQANLLALEASEADYQTINVSSGELWSVGEVARLVLAAMGGDGAIEIAEKFRAGDIRHCHADLTRARRLLGFQPRIGLREGLPRTIDWARSQAIAGLQPREDAAARELEAHGLLR